MRIATVAVVVGMVVLGSAATAQAPAAQPHASLAQLMRGILFPNANILFDVQTKDPTTIGKKEDGAGASASFSGIYTGWAVVENSALALAESASLIMVPKRLCENGRPVPLQRPDWVKYTQELRAAGMKMYEVAQTKNKELASDTTNDIAAACENCHIAYRDKPGNSPRCTP